MKAAGMCPKCQRLLAEGETFCPKCGVDAQGQPAGPPPVPPPVPPPPSTPPSKATVIPTSAARLTWKSFLIVLVSVVFFLCIFFYVVAPGTKSPDASTPSESPGDSTLSKGLSVGEEGILWDKSSATETYLAASKESLKKMLHNVAARDEYGLEEMAYKGEIFKTPQPVKVLVIDKIYILGVSAPGDEVRILEGRDAGIKGCVIPGWVSKG